MANGQCLTQPAKDHFLMSNQSRQTYTVRGDLLGPLAGSLPDITNQVRRAASRTGGRIQLGGVMQLYDLAITVVPSRLAGKFHHQYLSLIHISEPTRRTPISYAVFCLKKKKKKKKETKVN